MSGVTAAAMRALEQAAFERGVDPGELMDAAGRGLAKRLLGLFPGPGTAVAYLGKGNNAGDAVVVLEELQRAGWQVALRAAYPEHQWSVLTRQRLRRLGVDPLEASAVPLQGPVLLLDGLLGIGGKGGLREPLTGLGREMEDLRRRHGAQVVAVDLPSGVDADSGEAGDTAVVADWTFTIGAPKCGLMTEAAVNHVGRLVLVPLADLPVSSEGGMLLACPEVFPELLPPRPHEFHKGRAGRVAVLAGSPGMTGAAVLAASGALRGGAGLVTLHLDPATYGSMAAALPAEVMVRVSEDPVMDCFGCDADARVIGPGLGSLSVERGESLHRGLRGSRGTLVVLDADGLNWIASASHHDLLDSSFLITPHPGEFGRLAPDLAGSLRGDAARAFVKRHACTLLLKGARTLVAAGDGRLSWNPTGNAGMASGGQGDVLAGVAGALLAAGNPPADAGMLAAWLCGRAAEHTVSHGDQSEESLLAGDVLDHLGAAFSDWRQRRR